MTSKIDGIDSTDEMGGSIENTQGMMKVRKGTLDGEKLFVSWDVIPMCTAEACPAVDYCKYLKGTHLKCKIMKDYLQSVNLVIFRNFKGVFEEDQMMRIGLELIPLYRILCKLKIEEIPLTQVTGLDDKGIRRANPIYKEIRETIKLISAVWRSLKVDVGHEPPEPKPGEQLGKPGEIVKGDFVEGNPDFHSNLEEEIRKEAEERRKAEGKGRLMR